MADDVTRWLEGLGLGQYALAFSDNAVGFGDLRHLTDEDLTHLGLPLGPRRRLQAAVKALAESSKASIEPERPVGHSHRGSGETIRRGTPAAHSVVL